MKITLQVSEEVARTLHQLGHPTPSTKALLRQIKRLKVTLEPLHPGSDDPNLQRYFIVSADNVTTAQRVATQLQKLDGIQAAYVKPPDAPP